MLSDSALKTLLVQPGFSRMELILLCLAAEPLAPRQVKEVRQIATSLGLRKAAKWNVSQILGASKPYATGTDEGWELTEDGEIRVAELAGPAVKTRRRRVAAGLRHHLADISEETTRAFVEEGIECLEAGLYRAAVVLTWVGAIAVLQDHVVSEKLKEFNKAAGIRDAKWKASKTQDDLGRMKEHSFLQILQDISVIGKNVRQELEGALRLRNGCGHPNSLQVGEARAAAHVETLVLNVFSKF